MLIRALTDIRFREIDLFLVKNEERDVPKKYASKAIEMGLAEAVEDGGEAGTEQDEETETQE